MVEKEATVTAKDLQTYETVTVRHSPDAWEEYMAEFAVCGEQPWCIHVHVSLGVRSVRPPEACCYQPFYGEWHIEAQRDGSTKYYTFARNEKHARQRWAEFIGKAAKRAAEQAE